MIILQSAAYAGSLARASLDVAMSYAVFAQNPIVLFSGPAVSCLVATQQPESLGRKSLRKVIDSFPLYDIETIYADAQSMESLGLRVGELPDFCELVDAQQRTTLTREASYLVCL